VDLLDRRFPLKGQFGLIHNWRQYSVEITWEVPLHAPQVTMSIVAGPEAQVEDDDPRLMQ
jgi:hypothetical protein